MGFTAAAVLQQPRRPWSLIVRDWLWIAVVSFIATFPVQQLRAFPSSLSDCQTPTGWNCSGDDDRDTDLFLCDTNTCKFDGECLRIGDIITCICDFKCNNDYVPVCGSNNENYENECLLRRDACKQQTEILVLSEGSCPVEAGSGSGDEGNEGSAENGQKETSTCDICQFGASCDVDAEDVWCVCNIDCSHISFNPVCASDGRSYDNPCQVKEASCQRQERIEVKFLGHCQGDMITGTSPGDGHYVRADYPEEKPEVSEVARGLYIPCPEHYKNYCVHGDCEYPNMLSIPSCSCHSGFIGPQCDTKEYNVLYVGCQAPGKLRYVLIASIIGALQVAIICVVVLCITRKCPRTNRINRQKQNVTHYNSENTLRASTRLI
ncbi:LOW QUALITY PROTEIN: tomoregulin-2a [Electrophorus electricus]|uniref:LOW QUALITY PROTEIN: tomoregulin-2a n=1 Tax=Electrophorus electricus TaxID=8005 RepID=UPI0015D0A194|nr:LOW QUALITY PROTEIN: tomoregulin-2a [Electrophorus electricus]